MNTRTFRNAWAALALAITLPLLASGCMAPAHVAMKVEKTANARTAQRGMEVLRQHIKVLQEQGDPLGDYYYALANSDGWIHDVTDPKAITALFEKAATKGSMDAKILLALQVATSEPIPGQLDDSKGPRENLEAWERGLAQLLPLLKQQCYARRLVLDEGLPKVAYYSISGDIWPKLRDGRHRKNGQGQWELYLPKDPVRQHVWESLDRGCRTPNDDWLR